MPTLPTSLFVQHYLSHSGWQHNVLVTLNSNGTIARLSANSSAIEGSLKLDMLIPGMPNVHSHSFQYAMAGLAEQAGADGDHFWSWREWMYRFASQITPEQLHAIATQLYIDMLKSGYTSVGEFHYLHHQPDGTPYANHAELSMQVIWAAEQTHLPITHLPVLYSHSDVGSIPATQNQQRFTHSLDEFIRLWLQLDTATKNSERVTLGAAPHSLRATSMEQITALAQSLPSTIPTHIHIAEQQREVEAVQHASGARPVQWLLDNAAINQHWCFIHATHMNEIEATALAQSGAVAGLCPLTEANLGDGIFPMQPFDAAQGRWAIGSDSHILLNPFEELRLLDYGQRLANQQRLTLVQPNNHAASQLWLQAVQNGQQALGIMGAGMEVGQKLDAIALSLSHPLYAGRSAEQMLNTALYALPQPNISHVFAQGVHAIQFGQHTLAEASNTDFTQAMQQLLRT